MAVRIIKKSWWVDFRFAYTRYRKRSPENSKAGAQAYEATLRQRLTRGEPIDQTGNNSQQVQTFEEFARSWFEEYVVSNNKFSEQKTKQTILRSSLVPFFGKMSVEGITAHHIEQYKAHELKRGVSRKTVNNHLTVLRKCITTAYEWLELPGAPPKIAWLKCPPPKTDHLSSDECGLLLSHADGVVREMILVALRTGMRLGELKGLQWSSIDWHNRMLTVRHSQCDYTKELVTPKSNRERHIPLDSDVYEALFKRKKDTGYAFAGADGGPFNSFRLSCRLEHVRNKAGLRKIGWHTLRHTFASQLVMRGVPLTAVQALMGHSTITTTMRYAHLAPSTLRAAIDMLNPKTALNADFGQPVGNQWIDQQKGVLAQKNQP
ncbi:MAG TPA: tyrosine-type recombinase/integrase [Candidatus Paceibacterota bacterium]|nr:tyrosine-type recombinase/integrase [Candidatus Paceibacterota bacterium]